MWRGTFKFAFDEHAGARVSAKQWVLVFLTCPDLSSNIIMAEMHQTAAKQQPNNQQLFSTALLPTKYFVACLRHPHR
jgi:hypothetical protein